MTQEEKQLLLKALCGYFPYGLKVSEYFEESEIWTNPRDFEDVGPYYILLRTEKIKPYLRPMSSMTLEERVEYDKYVNGHISLEYHIKEIDWLNANHFDYRGLIEKGLALEAPAGMYSVKISTTVEHQESEEPKFLNPDNSVVESTKQHIGTIKQQFGVRKQRTVEEIEKDLEYADEAQVSCIRMINRLETELFEARFGIEKSDRILLASGKTVCYDYYIPLLGGYAMCHPLKKNGEPSVRTIRVKQSDIIKKQED